MMRIKTYIVIAAVILFGTLTASAQKPAEVLDKTVSKIKNAGSIDCSFAVTGNGVNTSGSLKAEGSKFKLSVPGSTTWFDGTDMWTSNSKTKEITLVNPTTDELRESNPFEYINGYKKTYSVHFSKRKEDKYHLVLLNPLKKGGEIKAVEIAINKQTMLPERFIIRDRNDKVTTVMIRSLSLKSKGKGDNFHCPTETMGDYVIVDLR